MAQKTRQSLFDFAPEDLERLRDIIDQSQHIVIFPHTAPDGDAIGSVVGWGDTLARIYPDKEISLISPDNIEQNLRWIPGANTLLSYFDKPQQALDRIAEADLIFHLDHNQTSRLRHPELVAAVEKSVARRVLIDHHLDPEEGMDLYFSYPGVSSTSELVYRLITALKLRYRLGRRSATALLTGIITDTGRMMYGCFYPEVFVSIAGLLDRGADYSFVVDRLSYHAPESQIRLQSYALSEKLELFPELGTACITLTQEEMQRYSASKGDTEGLVNKPLEIEGINCVCLFREDKDQVKLSLRSIGNYAVNVIASRGFGGGGHLNAAGGEWQGSLQEAKNIYLYQLKQLLGERDEPTQIDN